jgi:predicted Zn-dependent protease
MRKSVGLLLILILGALLLVGVANRRALKEYAQSLFQEDEIAQQQKAEKLLKEGNTLEAVKILQANENSLEYQTEKGKKWVDLLIEISNQTRNAPQMINIYETIPEAFEGNEVRSLQVANAYIISSRTNDYLVLSEKWKDRAARPQDWLVLDADRLILDNQRNQAIKVLQSHTFEGANDTGRLVRLALLSLPDNPQQAWDYLNEAYKKDPQNPDIRTYRARLLEGLGKQPLALSEYIAAVKTSPNNIFLRDQLAEFYLRSSRYNSAISIWLEALKKTPYAPLWVKAFFWNRVVTPINYNWKSLAPEKSDLEPLVNYLENLPNNEFWNTKNFDKITNGQRFLTTQQATFWLRLINDLKNGRESDAEELLQYNPFEKTSWNHALEIALRRILNFRKTGRLNIDEAPMTTNSATLDSGIAAPNSTEGDFLRELNKYAAQPPPEDSSGQIPESLRALLLSKDAFSAVFLSTGWNEAAIQLRTLDVYPDSFPKWVAIAMTQALRTNRSNEEALTFAALQKPSEQISLLIGELLAASKQTDTALDKLRKMALEPTDVGLRASWLISQIYIERGEYQLAESSIESQPRLANSTLGKEVKARIALLQNNEQLANDIYTSILDSSAEAKSYVARRAYAAKDWSKAKQLTEELLIQYPDNTILNENLKKIYDEQQKSTTN